MDIETLCVVSAFAPGNDVRSTEERGIGDAGERAAALPVVHEAGAENVLSDPLDDEPLDLGAFRELCCLVMEGFQRRVRKAGGKLVNTRQDRVEFCEIRDGVTDQAGPGEFGGQEIHFSRDASMVDGDEPRA